ncbi:uncharacterized protein P174DRAFT_410761 [Aspergillus novofumigatus IBT 16806]|uniref:Uncharacterized protein n=1 Tax=Aspergillus novofumigatus (strain IBT 16806) TaxID=1392255 RepID=A0A2I1C2S9_ASPN1|nr:uncharacterized protein P174DRAFT_410761 [Aspergillus novofumigatus IBT 16806]PKX91893.1 hypothetical protein P174DRAFT_410761 [Aspergillus novofumigatus IBT 16806]
MRQSSRRHRHLAPDAQGLILKWLLERENSPRTYTNHHVSGPAEATRTKSQQYCSSGLPITQSASTPPRRALCEGSSFAQRSPPLNRIRWSPYPGRHPVKKGTITEKGSKGGFERKPRNKTREDRYEYKGSISRIQRKQSPTQARKSSKQVRRHTINDNFHASNVPRDRLTLHSHLDLGIFRRGKTSSPVKAGELRHLPHFSGIRKLVNRGRVPEKGFSETRFLSKKLGSDSRRYTNHQSPNNKRKARANSEDSQLLISSYFPLGSLEDDSRMHGFKMEASGILLHSSPNLQQQSPADCSVRGIAAKRHAAVAVQSPADQPKHSRAYHPDVQGCELSLSSTPTSISCNEHAAFLSESWSEFYMRQLLHFDLSSQDKDKDESTHPVRKYWKLEDLKLLLQERDKFRQQETGPQVVSERSFSGSRRNSGKASSIYKLEDADEDHSKQLKQTVLLEEMGNGFVEDNASLDTKFIFPAPLDKGLNDEPDFQHTSNAPLARPRKTTLANRSNAGPKEAFDSGSDTWKCPEYPTKTQAERFSSSVFQAGSFEQEADPQLASGTGRDKVDDDMIMFFAEEAQLQDDIYDCFATQALDAAAHDVIMHPEEDTLECVWDYAMRIPLSADSFENTQVAQDVLQNRVLVDEASLRCPWETVPCPSHGVLSSHGMERGLIDIPRDFWRQNRLY